MPLARPSFLLPLLDMGRPLFSSRQPSVRVEPEPQHPALQKWSYWNAFDPDSEEFFNNEDAVYEAFIDPADRIPVAVARPVSTVIDVESTSSSEPSSGRGTPMQEDADDIARPRVHRITTGGIRIPSTTTVPDAALGGLPREASMVRLISNLTEAIVAATGPSSTPEPAPIEIRQETRPPIRERVVTYLDLPEEEEEEEEASRTPSPEPDIRAMRSFPATPVRPSTPPAQVTPLFVPSPPPSVTPRLYSWSTLTGSGSPLPASPLTNRDARMSVAHIITPALIPAHRAA